MKKGKKKNQPSAQCGQNAQSLQTPVLPVAYIEDLFICSANDLLGDAISKGNENREALYSLFQAIMWANHYTGAAAKNDGKVPSHLNNDAIDWLITGLQCMQALGAF